MGLYLSEYVVTSYTCIERHDAVEEFTATVKLWMEVGGVELV